MDRRLGGRVVVCYLSRLAPIWALCSDHLEGELRAIVCPCFRAENRNWDRGARPWQRLVNLVDRADWFTVEEEEEIARQNACLSCW